MSTRRGFTALLLGLVTSVAWAQTPEAPAPAKTGKMDVVVERAELERGPQGVTFSVYGTASAPDRTRVRLSLRLEGGEGANLIADVTAGRFAARLGPFQRRVLPGLYEVVATIEPSIQRLEVADAVNAAQLTGGTFRIQVGTPEEAAAERAKLLAHYSTVIETLREMNGELDMWGSSVVMRSVGIRMRYPQEVPAQAARPLEADWNRFSDAFLPNLAAMRFDMIELGEFVLTGYFPQIVSLIDQVITTLDRWHAAFMVATWGNLGRAVPEDIQAKGAFGIDDLRHALRSLGEQAYGILGITPVTWRAIDGAIPERIEDAEGDLFHSVLSKFEVRKPSDWVFRMGNNPRMRLRMVPVATELDRRIVAGVELRDYPMADSFDDLASLDEGATRQTHPGFELRRIKRVTAPDLTMPNDIRPGQEITFVTVMGDKRFHILQYSLFCRWHKRTYTLVCIAELGLEQRFEPTFRSICDNFKVLDLPHAEEEGH